MERSLVAISEGDAARRPLRSLPTFDLADCYGPVGDYVRAWAPHTEANPAAVYAVALAAIGGLIGRTPRFHFGNVDHHVRLFPLLIGPTGSGRKGTALALGARQLLLLLDEKFARENVESGLSSAEGLIALVRDATPAVVDDKGKPIRPGDEGVADKRVIIVEGEMAGPLEAMAREGNRLSSTTRDAWDGVDLRTLVKRDPQRATEPHIVIIGAITQAELRKLMTSTSVVNGLANRFLPIWCARVQLLPEDSRPAPESLALIGRTLSSRITTARSIASVRWTDAAAVLWSDEYKRLAVVDDASANIRALLERGAPYVRRVAMLLALIDGTGFIDVCHLQAALRLWHYAADTWRTVYHDGTARSPLAEKLLAALVDAGPHGLTRTEIRENVVRSGDVAADRITDALTELESSGLALRTKAPTTGGRRAERWCHARYAGKGDKGSNECQPTPHRENSPISPFPPLPFNSDGTTDDDDDGRDNSPPTTTGEGGPGLEVVPWPEEE